MQGGEHKGGNLSIWIHANQTMGAMLYRVNLLKQYDIRFYNIKASEDKIFLQCIYLADKIYLVNQLMYFYRQNATSAVHMLKKGIDYYVPIIDAYIQSDAEMKKWNDSTRGILHEGRILAKGYIMDMMEEEWQKIDGGKRLNELFIKKPEYLEILKRPTNNAMVDNREKAIYNHSKKIIIKNRIYGLVFKTARKIYYIRLVKYLADKKRYPIKI